MPVQIKLPHYPKSGHALQAEQDLLPVLTVHGFIMFVAWGILLPGGIPAARFLKHVKGDGWFQLHVYLQYSGIAIVFLGVLFAAAELRGFYITSVHVKFGGAAIVLACVQPVKAYLRSKKPYKGEATPTKRILWEYFHVMTGRCAIIVGIVALFSGMKHLGSRYDSENVKGEGIGILSEEAGCWETMRKMTPLIFCILRVFTEPELRPSGGMEVQLEPLGR